jgi:phage gp29-like protein
VRADSVRPNQTTSNIIEVTPVDEFGRPVMTLDRPILWPMFQPRVLDRRSGISPPWSVEQIISALHAAENGDMGPQADLFDMMEDRDAAFLGFYQTRKLAPAKLKWTIDPVDDSPKAKEVADFVSDEIHAIPNFPLAYRDAFDAIGKSISALWIDWQEGGRSHNGKAPKSKFRIDGIHHINPKRYRFHWSREEFLILPDYALQKAQEIGILEPSFGPTTFDQFHAIGIGVQPPPWKVIIHRTRVKSGHPAKAGVARVCALSFYMRNAAFKDMSIYCEVYGMPLRVAKYPPGTNEEDKAKIAMALEQLASDASAIVANNVDLELVESRSRTGGGTPFLELISECERQMQLALVGQDQTNTHNPTGGRTQVAEGGAPIRQDLIEADCVDAQATFKMQLCYPIVGFSDYGWQAAETLCPRFKIHFEPESDYTEMIGVDESLYTTLKLPVTYNMLAKRYGRELPGGFKLGDEIIDFAPPLPPPNPFGVPAVPGKPGFPPVKGVPPRPGVKAVPPAGKPGNGKVAAPPPPKGKGPAPKKVATAHAASDDAYFANARDRFRTLVTEVGWTISDLHSFYGGANTREELIAAFPDAPDDHAGRTITDGVIELLLDQREELKAELEQVRLSITPDDPPEVGLPHDFATTQINMPDDVAANVLGLGTNMIAPEDLAGDGLEPFPHCTVKYGIAPDETLDDVRLVVEAASPGKMVLGKTSHFSTGDYDVVFVSVDSPDLEAINARITAGLRTTPTQSGYVPHVTIAYVVSGAGAKYDGDDTLENTEIGFASVWYASAAATREVTEIPLKGEVAMPGEQPEGDLSHASRAFDSIKHGYATTQRMDDIDLSEHAARVPKARRGQKAIDQLSDRAQLSGEAALATLIAPARAIVLEAKSLSDLHARLRKAFGDLDATELETLVRRATYIARLHGMAAAKREAK